MKIVIDIPKEIYDALYVDYVFNPPIRNGKTLFSILHKIIANGTPLPKGHGRLIDADWVKNTLDLYTLNFDGIYKQFIRRSDIDTVPTIIEGSESE